MPSLHMRQAHSCSNTARRVLQLVLSTIWGYVLFFVCQVRAPLFFIGPCMHGISPSIAASWAWHCWHHHRGWTFPGFPASLTSSVKAFCEYYARFNPVLHSIFRIAHGHVFASCIIACRFVACQAQRNIRCPFWLKATSLVNA